MEAFSDHMPASVPPSCLTALRRRDAFTLMVLADLLRLVLNTFEGKRHGRARRSVTSEIRSSTKLQKWRTGFCNSLTFHGTSAQFSCSFIIS